MRAAASSALMTGGATGGGVGPVALCPFPETITLSARNGRWGRPFAFANGLAPGLAAALLLPATMARPVELDGVVPAKLKLAFGLFIGTMPGGGGAAEATALGLTPLFVKSKV